MASKRRRVASCGN